MIPWYWIFLDKFFLLFHSLFTLFNLFGWIWKKTRKIHLLTMGLTLFSWIFLGIWYGFGYCFCTQWHWNVRAKMGRIPDARGYIQFLLQELTGKPFSYQWVESVTLWVMAFLVLATLAVNLRDLFLHIRRKKNLPGA